ncbi:MAG TPA: CoA transferase [Casimicrobiaceae bacterium]|jgi:crotonobetainyl-CoA:carnitine CoA-transferase CaiB-like acyl-CoA transferase|nr:CoA transferase [Casimicrobiaceae bacterium]
MGPLTGLKVIELAHIMSGPTAGMLLADMGADVIKVERVPDGDDTRRFTPPEVNGESSAFMMMNRNKRGIALDLKQPAANAALRRIIDRADVVVENFRVGTMERLGLGYEVLRRTNPRLIYCALSGYGLTGPDAIKGGFDLVAQGLSGLMRITGDPGGPPTKVGSPVTDINAGILGALGIVSAYVHLLRSGEGQLVDTSLLEAGVMQTFWQSAIFIGSGREIGPLGSAHPMTAPYQAFETGDGWITVGASNQVNYVRLTQVLEAPELRDDPRFADNKLRMANLEALVDELTSRFKRKPSAAWLAALDAAGVPAGAVKTIEQMLADPQVRARDMVVDLAHPKAGETQAIGCPIKFSATPSHVARPAPMLGQHTSEVLGEFGFSVDEIRELLGAGAAVQG